MACQHAGHDADCTPEPLCPGCFEVVRDQAAHRCLPIGWSEPLELVTFRYFDPSPCTHDWSQPITAIRWQRPSVGKSGTAELDHPIRICNACGAIDTIPALSKEPRP